MGTTQKRANEGADPELISACRRGERSAFRRLFDLYREPAYRLAYRFAGNADDAEDLTQEIFVRAFERIGSYRCESSFSTWLYRLAANVCLNERRKPRLMRVPEENGIEIPGDSPDPVEVCLERERESVLMDAVASLPEGLRIVFILVSLEGLSYAEAAESLALTTEAVRMRMSRARRQLREDLERRGGRS
jgi:RNA polymerase sigma-70 factor (ECF subfamily)